MNCAGSMLFLPVCDDNNPLLSGVWNNPHIQSQPQVLYQSHEVVIDWMCTIAHAYYLLLTYYMTCSEERELALTYDKPWSEGWKSPHFKIVHGQKCETVFNLWKFMTRSVKQPLFMTAHVQKCRTAPIHDSPY